MPPAADDADIASLTFSVGRLAGAVEALTSRLNRTDDFIDSHFRELSDKIDNHVKPLVADVVAIATRVTTMEAQKGRFPFPTAALSAIIGALASGLFARFWH